MALFATRIRGNSFSFGEPPQQWCIKPNCRVPVYAAAGGGIVIGDVVSYASVHKVRSVFVGDSNHTEVIACWHNIQNVRWHVNHFIPSESPVILEDSLAINSVVLATCL